MPRGNPYHKPAGSPNSSGGEFTSGPGGGFGPGSQMGWGEGAVTGASRKMGIAAGKVSSGLSTGDKTSDAAVRSPHQIRMSDPAHAARVNKSLAAVKSHQQSVARTAKSVGFVRKAGRTVVTMKSGRKFSFPD